MTIQDEVEKTKKSAPPLDVKALLLGPTGSGKTQGALTLPGKKLVFDTDIRAGWADLSEVDVIQYPPDKKAPAKPWFKLVSNVEELWTIVNKGGEFPYSAIIFDGLSSLSNLAMKWALTLTGADNKTMGTAPGGGPAQPHYGPQMIAVMDLVRGSIPLPCHVVFTGHIEMREDKYTKRLSYYPQVFGNIRSQISSLFNETYESFRKKDKDGKLRFYWNTCGDADRLNFLKSSFNRPLGSLWQDPFEVDLTEVAPGFQKILALAKKGGGK